MKNFTCAESRIKRDDRSRLIEGDEFVSNQLKYTPPLLLSNPNPLVPSKLHDTFLENTYS